MPRHGREHSGDAGTPSGGEPQAGLSRRDLIAGAGAAAAAAVLPKREAAAASGPSVYRIHPAIGIARMGNADADTFFIGPEVPGYGPSGDAPGTMAPTYKANGLVKPQGARFRIWEYRWVSGVLTPVGEINLDTPGVTTIKWTAHLANKKSSFRKFFGPAGESSPYVSPLADTSVAPFRNASVVDRSTLETDFGPRSISGASQGPRTFGPDPAYAQTYPRKSDGTPVIDYLGQLRTDGAGRLIVLGGKGKAGFSADAQPPLPTYANNEGWFDDASDGPVTATVTVNGVDVAAEGAWVLCAPPDFAPRIRPVVTLYDLLTDMAVRFLPVPANALYAAGGPLAKIPALKAAYAANPDNEFPGYLPSFADDIFPVLRSAYDFWWVTSLVNQKHQSLLDPTLNDPSPGALKARQGVFIYLRPPIGVNSNVTGPMTMPRQQGDDPYVGQESDSAKKLTLTHLQYGLFRNWANGNFLAAPAFAKLGPPSALPPPAGSGVITPDGLDRAALENAQGGAFFPGIEASWQIRNPKLFKEPFRIDLAATSQYLLEDGIPIGPGHFSRQMAVPWHADFNDCRHEGDFAWWPAQRPDDALPFYGAQQRLDWARPNNALSNQQQKTTHEDMLANWFKYGFVLYTSDPAGVAPPQYVETERNAQIP